MSVGIIVSVICLIYMVAILCMAFWMEEQTHKTPHIPETDLETRCKHIKLRIEQAEWEAERRRA